MTRAEAAKAKAELIQAKQDLLLKSISQAEASLYTRILDQFIFELELTDGNVSSNGKNIELVNAVDKIYKAFQASDYVNIIESFTSDMYLITRKNSEYYRILGEAQAKIPEAEAAANANLEKQLGLNKNGSINKNGYLDRLIQDKTVLKSIKKTIYQGIAQNVALKDMKEMVSKKIEGTDKINGELTRYLNNNLLDTYQQHDATAGETFARSIGLEAFIYSGGLIGTSRCFCESRNGKVFTRVQAQKWVDLLNEDCGPIWNEGKDGNYDPIQMRGGYGCRHSIDWISDAEAARRGITIETPPELTPAQKKEFDAVDRIKKLTPENLVLQEDSIRQFVTKKKELTNKFLKENGKIVNTDDARKLFKGYAGHNAAGVHEASSALSKEALKSLIANGKLNVVTMYAGGAGSGKTSAIKQLIPDVEKNTDAILDGNLASYQGAIKKVEDFLSKGKQVEIKYTYRDPMDAWENGVIKRMLTNKAEMGRVVSLTTFMENTKGSLNTIKTMIDSGLNDVEGVNIQIIDNSFGYGKADFMDKQKFDNLKYDDNLRAQLEARTLQLLREGKISQVQYDALIQ